MKKYLFLILFLITYSLVGQDIDLSKIDQYIEKAVKDWDAPGLSVAIVKDGEIVHEKGYGELEKGIGIQPDEHTLYAIASNTKAFTSAIIAQLVEEGKLDWDDPVQRYLPYFEIYDPQISSLVTVRDLLSHRVGLGTFHGDVIWYRSDFSGEEIIKRIKHVKQSYPFRSGYGYSNLMFITAGELIETVTGKRWEENVKMRLLSPVGMDRTIASVKDLDSKGNYATPHIYRDGQHTPTEWVAWDNVQATGGLISSVHDIGKWMITNMNHGIINEDTLFSIANRNQMWKPHANITRNHAKLNNTESHFSSYGLGWFLGDYKGNFHVRHGGGYDGMISAVHMLPDHKLGVVVLTNGVKVPTNAISYYIFDRYLEKTEKDWSGEMLKNAKNFYDQDADSLKKLREGKIKNAPPTFGIDKIVGNYSSDAYGIIEINEEMGKLMINFTRSPHLKAELRHFNYDVYEIAWEYDQPWFSFGTVQFTKTNRNEIKGIEFDVPNYDFFFEELNAEKIER